jgi:hypothetical protein
MRYMMLVRGVAPPGPPRLQRSSKRWARWPLIALKAMQILRVPPRPSLLPRFVRLVDVSRPSHKLAPFLRLNRVT